MSYFKIQTDAIIDSSQEIVQMAKKLTALQTQLNQLKAAGILEGSYREAIDQSISRIIEDISDEAVHMNSLGDALQVIVNRYQNAEKAAMGLNTDGSSASSDNAGSEESGSDKRNIFEKFWDWITRKEPDDYDTTDDEQEKAADTAMKQELWEVLQDEKYSQDHWDNSSVEERKQILQDYMDEVIRIYGLQDVKNKINWDSGATYTTGSVTWGYYTHKNHTVTLNERVLSDDIESWDSYALLETVSHELRHAYQHEAIDHPTRYKVSQETLDTWEDNFDHYIKSSDDYEGYRSQSVEVDARDFQVNRDTPV